MGTSKHVAIVLLVALTGVLAAGQSQPTAPAQTAALAPSNTRSASCLVRITVDPALLPLNPETVGSLIHSPAVLVKAGRNVLSLSTPEDFSKLFELQDSGRPLLTIKWLNTSSAPRNPAARLSDMEAFRRQMEDIYGPAYTQQMMGSPNEEKKGETGSPVQKDTLSGPVREDHSNAPSIGGMGVASGAAQAQGLSTEVRRQSGESDVAYRTRLAQIRAQQQAARREVRSGGMGSMGGGMGGYGVGGMGMAGMGGYGGMGMGGMGMGSTGGGMMRGYGGMGGIGFDPTMAAAPQGVEQSATLELQVNLPDTVPPRADVFLASLVTNLQDSLSRAYESYIADMEVALTAATVQHRNVEREMEGRASDVSAVRQQLESVVDLSQLTSGTPLDTAIESVRKSVEPPLNIVVLWRDMQTNAHIEPGSPINIDGLPRIRLGTALDLLVKGMYAGVDKTTTPMWRIKDDTVVIGTTATLGRPQEGAEQPYIENDARNLAGQRSELARRIQSLELDLAGLDARREAIVAQIANVQQQVSEKVGKDPVVYELEKLADLHRPTVVKNPQGQSITINPPEEQEKAIRAKIELANRREELSKQVGGSQLEEFNKELSRMAIDKAEKEAQLQIVRKQLDEVQKQLAQALTFDPEAARLRLAQESLDIAAHRVAELQTRLANLQPPMVTTIGAN